MNIEPTWIDLARDVEELGAVQALWAEWLAYQGSEDYGLWFLRPDGRESDGARATFSLIAAQIVSKLGITPIPVPKPLQYCPHWELSCKTEEEMARREGKVLDLSDEVPHGLDRVDFDAVDPCTRALLEFLRRESPAFRISSTGSDWIKGTRYPTVAGTIEDLGGSVAALCKRRARDEIGAQLNRSASLSNFEERNPAGSRSPLTQFPNDEATSVYSPTVPDRSEVGSGTMTRIARAKTVARVIKELGVLKPQLFEAEEEYRRLENQYSDFLSFSIARNRPDLRRKILAIQGSRRHIKLALEIVAAHYGVSPGTIDDDWKDCKPKNFRRPKGP